RCRDGTDRFFNGVENPKLFPPSSHYPHTNTIIQLPSWANDGFIARGERPLHGGFFRNLFGRIKMGNASDEEKLEVMKSLCFGIVGDTGRLLSNQGFNKPIDIIELAIFAMFVVTETYIFL